jgi:hypothetical protein
VCTFQTLSQFMNLERVFEEVTRVLQPGGVFLFAEEPLLRALSLRLYRCPYYENMKPWERRLYDWGLLGYLVRDVIGAHQEESFGIRQNHSLGLKRWDALVRKYFAAREYEIFVPQRGWGERVVQRIAVRLDPNGSEWQAAKWLGGTLAAVCRKSGAAPPAQAFSHWESYLRCPDCRGDFSREAGEALRCAKCGYKAAAESGVYNLLPSAERRELYPGERADILDFSVPGHERGLLEGWHKLEGVHGNKYRWIGARAVARLARVKAGAQRLRIRGHAFAQGVPGQVQVRVNSDPAGSMKLRRTGLFVFEADIPDAPEYTVEIHSSPVWNAPGDDRDLSVTVAMIRLVDR